jgi:hypothetical protein
MAPSQNGNFIKFAVFSIAVTVLPLLTFSFKVSELYLSGVVIIVLGLGEMVSQRGKADFTVKFHFYFSIFLIVYGSFLYGAFKGREHCTSIADAPAAQHAPDRSATDADTVSIPTIPPPSFLIIAIILGSSAAYFSNPPPGQVSTTAPEGGDQDVAVV